MTYFVRLAVATLLATPLTVSAAPAVPDTRLALVDPLVSTHSIPTDDELRQRGARIGRIQIQIDNVFETTAHLAAPYRLANGLHISTHEQTVGQQLLFRSGEPYDRRLLDETARLLRGQRYLNEATVEPIRYNEDNTVDVSVRVHDVWTLSPGISFGRKGGENSSKIRFEDTNFLGLGKQISLARSSDVDRNSWRLGYVDPNLLGTWWKLSTAYSSLTDGSEKLFGVERPFYSLDTRWSAGTLISDTTSSVSRYSLGKRIERFDMQGRQLGIGGGISQGLRDGWALRYLGGFRYDDRAFMPRADEPLAAIPDDRTLAYPWVGLEVIEDEYVSTRNLDQIGRTEDLYLGRSARVELGFASSAFGSSLDALMLRGTLQIGADLGREQYLINTLDMSGRIEGGTVENGRLDVGTRYYRRHSTRSVFFASVTGSLASNLDPEEQLLLGGDNGLRGYPLRYQAGTASALLTLEERFYTDWQPLKLFNVGAAVFVDTGRAGGKDEFAAAPQGWLTDVGVGLRLGSARSGLGNVLHIDLAFPLNGGNDIDSAQLLIETRRSF